MKRTRKNQGFKMAGTEGSFQYKVPVTTPLGRIGYRNLGRHGTARIRIEPANASAAAAMAANFPSAWKKGYGGGTFRFSLVITNKEDRKAAITLGLKAIGAIPGEEGVRINSKAPKFIRELMNQVRA